MSDIAFDGMVFDRLAQIGDQSQRIAELEREIERLRLTDAEREAVDAAVGRSRRIGTGYAIIDTAVLSGFLERHKGGEG